MYLYLDRKIVSGNEYILVSLHHRVLRSLSDMHWSTSTILNREKCGPMDFPCPRVPTKFRINMGMGSVSLSGCEESGLGARLPYFSHRGLPENLGDNFLSPTSFYINEGFGRPNHQLFIFFYILHRLDF